MAKAGTANGKAICLDLDIAVQGSSFEEVFASLRDAIALYLETVADLPPEERHSLLHRRAPFPMLSPGIPPTAVRQGPHGPDDTSA